MLKEEWEKITKNDVVVAICMYKRGEEKDRISKNTFLKYNNYIYPAKYIRGLAYYAHFGVDKLWEEYNDGKETKEFFENLGFDIIEKNNKENVDVNFCYEFERNLKNRVNELDNIEFIDPNEPFNFKIYVRPEGEENQRHVPIEFVDNIGIISSKIFDEHIKDMQTRYPNEKKIKIRDFNFKIEDLIKKDLLKM